MKKNGISLIVLVITIIVMIILAAAIIIAINNNNVVDKAKDAVSETNLKQIQEMAQALWADAYIDGARTQEALEIAVIEGLKGTDTSKYTITVTTSGVSVSDKLETPVVPNEPEGPVTHSGRIPNGATYYVGITSTTPGDYESATATYTEGQSFPAEVKKGDVYVYGDYEYRYDMSFSLGIWFEIDPVLNGWGVRVIDKTKSSYGEIINNINNKDVNCLQATFYQCANMTVAPEIPETITLVGWIFSDCTSLTVAPVFDNHIENTNNAFRFCTNLSTYEGSTEEPGCFSNYPIPSNLTNAAFMFSGCSLIKTAPNFSGATRLENMSNTFDGCEKLEVPPILPNSLKNMNCIFYDCKALKTAPDIPSTVTSLTEAFYNCSTLVTAPTIPANVNDMQHTFANCINLTGTITINANPKYTSGCFYGTVKPIRITGACNESIKENLKGVYTNISY